MPGARGVAGVGVGVGAVAGEGPGDSQCLSFAQGTSFLPRVPVSLVIPQRIRWPLSKRPFPVGLGIAVSRGAVGFFAILHPACPHSPTVTSKASLCPQAGAQAPGPL